MCFRFCVPCHPQTRRCAFRFVGEWRKFTKVICRWHVYFIRWSSNFILRSKGQLLEYPLHSKQPGLRQMNHIEYLYIETFNCPPRRSPIIAKWLSTTLTTTFLFYQFYGGFKLRRRFDYRLLLVRSISFTTNSFYLTN